MQKNGNVALGYLPDENPPIGKLIVFALQQIVVMFPATVLVALITGFHVSTTIFASGLATMCFILVTGRKIPLYYGSSFSYIAAISALMAAQKEIGMSHDDAIRVAQFGIIMSGLVSIAAGLVIRLFGQESIEKVLPATITGTIALIIGLSLAMNAMQDLALRYTPDGVPLNNAQSNLSWLVTLVTLLSVILFSIYLKGTWKQLPVLLGLLAGYLFAVFLQLVTPYEFLNTLTAGKTFAEEFTGSFSSLGNFFVMPKFSLPLPRWEAIFAIMPIAIATIPESTAHLYQLDIYVNNLAKSKNSPKTYKIADKLGLNLIGDGIGDIVSGFIGGPAGTNYGENISTMAVTKNFSTTMLMTAAAITMLISFINPLTLLVYSIPLSVISGLSIYLFGVIGAQGITIMIDKKVDMFDSRNLAVIAVILIVGLGGHYAFGGMIPVLGIEVPALATAAILGILLNLLLNIGRKKEQAQKEQAQK